MGDSAIEQVETVSLSLTDTYPNGAIVILLIPDVFSVIPLADCRTQTERYGARTDTPSQSVSELLFAVSSDL